MEKLNSTAGVNERELKVLSSLVKAYDKKVGYGVIDINTINIEGFSKMQVGAYITILSNKGWINVEKKEKGASCRKFVITDKTAEIQKMLK
jgi:hypothetical protein